MTNWTTTTRASTASVLAMALAGCGGGSGSSTAVDAFDAIFIGAQSESQSGTGLPFADGTQSLTDAAGQEMTVKLAQAYWDYDTSTQRISVTDETVTLSANYLTGSDEDFVITFNGETVDIVSDSGFLANGTDVSTWTYYDGDRFSVEGFYGDGGTSGTQAITALFAFGYETDPSVIAARTGVVTYSGDFDGYGNTLSVDDDFEDFDDNFSGDITLSADFDASRISGTYSGSAEGDLFSGIIAETDILNNGFASTLETTCADGFTCTSSGEIGGVFYGDDAQELGGVLTFDHKQVDGEGVGYRFSGAGGFGTSAD